MPILHQGISRVNQEGLLSASLVQLPVKLPELVDHIHVLSFEEGADFAINAVAQAQFPYGELFRYWFLCPHFPGLELAWCDTHEGSHVGVSPAQSFAEISQRGGIPLLHQPDEFFNVL
jgi:hypothetical protein